MGCWFKCFLFKWQTAGRTNIRISDWRKLFASNTMFVISLLLCNTQYIFWVLVNCPLALIHYFIKKTFIFIYLSGYRHFTLKLLPTKQQKRNKIKTSDKVSPNCIKIDFMIESWNMYIFFNFMWMLNSTNDCWKLLIYQPKCLVHM